MGNRVIKPAARNLTRPLKNYNVEERAMKVISRDKPKPAPPLPSMEKIMKDIANGKLINAMAHLRCVNTGNRDPTVAERAKLDPILAKQLQHVYLKSRGDNPEIVRKITNLPLDRNQSVEPEFGFVEPVKITEGKATLRQILEFLRLHHNHSEEFPAYKIAEAYKLDIEDVKSILEYYRPFEITYPEPKKEPSAFMKAIKA